MGVVKRCEIKRHKPYTGEKCPTCNRNEQNAAFAGLMCAALFIATTIVMLVLIVKLK